MARKETAAIGVAGRFRTSRKLPQPPETLGLQKLEEIRER